MSEKLDLILSELKKMNARIERMEQAARNAELESTVEELSAAVSENTTDIKLIKRILTNQ